MWEPFSTHMWGRGPIALRPLTSFLLYILLFSIALLFRAWASKYVGGGAVQPNSLLNTLKSDYSGS